MSDAPKMAIGGSMNDKASVNIKPADNGGFIVSRSWDEKEGKETKYRNQDLIFAQAPTAEELIKMFEPDEYKKGAIKTEKKEAEKGGYGFAG